MAMRILLPVSVLVISCVLSSNVQQVHGKGIGAAAMFLPPGCKELYDDIQKKVKASSPKLHAWVKEECDKECKGKASFTEAVKYEDYGFTFVDKMNEWFKKQKPALDIYTLCPKAFTKKVSFFSFWKNISELFFFKENANDFGRSEKSMFRQHTVWSENQTEPKSLSCSR